MINKVSRNEQRIRRHKRVRRKISGTPECPRLCVFRSNANIEVQIIDDVAGNTLVTRLIATTCSSNSFWSLLGFLSIAMM